MEPYRDKFSDNRALQKLFESSIYVKNSRTIDKPINAESTQKNTASRFDSNIKEGPLNPVTSDSCSQTSKTILQLAKLEISEQPVDSLNTTPRKYVEYSEMPSESTELHYQNINIQFMRKNDILDYIGNIGTKDYKPQENLKLEKSLTERFLENKNKKSIGHLPRIYRNPRNLNSSTSNCIAESKTKFLFQTSPLKNAPSISEFEYPDESMASSPISRFTIKRKCVQEFTENTVPVEQYLNEYQKTEKGYGINNLLDMPMDMAFQQNLTGNLAEVPSLKFSLQPKPRATRKYVRSHSFMMPTISSQMKSQKTAVEVSEILISPTRRGRSISPTKSSCNSPPADTRGQNSKRMAKIPYIDERNRKLIHEDRNHMGLPKNSLCSQSPTKCISHVSALPSVKKTDLVKEHLLQAADANANAKNIENTLQINKLKITSKASNESIVSTSSKFSGSNTSTSSESTIEATIAKLRSQDWNVALQGLAEITGLCRLLESDILYPYMPSINRRLLDLLRSPRSHVCRTACQAAGHLFQYMKDTRRPEFDDIVDVLLFKTADSNKFIRQDANLSLDCLVTHIPTFHCIRSLCTKGPTHKNNLVRTATIRLIVCAVVICGTDFILNVNASECTKKRIVMVLAKFFSDNCQEARKYAERLYKVLYKHPNFDSVLKKYLEKECVIKMKSYMKNINKSNLGSF